MALVVKNPPAKARDVRDVGSIPGSGRSLGERNGNLLQYSCLENPHGQRSLVGYGPGGHKELDATKHAQSLPHHAMAVGDGFWFVEIS